MTGRAYLFRCCQGLFIKAEAWLARCSSCLFDQHICVLNLHPHGAVVKHA